jgi:hypothetical protein
MAFSVLVEMLNLKLRSQSKKPIELHARIARSDEPTA